MGPAEARIRRRWDAYKVLVRRSRAAAKKDKQEWWDKEAAAMEEDIQKGNLDATYRRLKFLQIPAVQPIQSLRGADGSILQSEGRVKQRWAEYFGALLGELALSASNSCWPAMHRLTMAATTLTPTLEQAYRPAGRCVQRLPG